MKLSTDRPRLRHSLILYSLLAVGPLVQSPTAWSAVYGVTVIGVGAVFDLNNRGMVVGRSSLGEPFVWSSGSITTLPKPLGALEATPISLNDAGIIVGFAEFDAAGRQAVYWNSGSVTLLNDLDGENSMARGINSFGQIVGYSSDGKFSDGRALHAVRWTNWGIDFVGPQRSIANAINNNGDFVGKISNVAQIWDVAGGGIEAGNLGGADTEPSALNDSRQVIGSSKLGGHRAFRSHAYIWDAGQTLDIDALSTSRQSSVATDINDAGQVVGTLAHLGSAFLWEEGEMNLLNDLLAQPEGWNIFEAAAINDRGQIIGRGTIGGTNFSVLLTPVPLPSTLGLLLLGALGLSRNLRRGAARS